MPDLDEFLRNELRRTVKPVDVNDVSSRIDLRRTRRARTRKIQSVALAVVVIAGSLAGVAVLRSVFREPGPGVGPASDVRNGVIVYSEVRNAGQHLWVVNPDGSGARQLTTDNFASDTDPSISLDGRTVAFVRTGADGSSICLIEIDGTGLREFSPLDVSAIAPSWSPDGTKIAFAGSDGGIYVAEIGGNPGPQLIVDRSFVATDLSWSPDGSRIAFSASGSTTAAQVGSDIWITDVVGVTQVNITYTSDTDESSPSWSPDGAQILFARSTSTGASLMAIEPDPDASPVALTDGTNIDLNPEWSPDGSRVVFDRTRAGGTDVYTMRADGSDLTLAARNATDPAWQPIPSDTTPSPSSPTTPSDGAGEDLGLGFPVCNVRTLGGDLSSDFDGNGSPDTAFVATKLNDVGGCPQADTALNILGIDVTGDGKIDAEYGPINCELDCMPFMAIDLDEDGKDELLVQQLGGAILGLVPYTLIGLDDVAADGVGINPLTVAPPGDPENGLPAGGPVTFYLGGDEGFSASLDCRRSGADRVLVATTGELNSIEQPTRWTIHRTTFRLGNQGLDVLDTETFDQLIKDVITPGSQQATNLCGIPFPPNPVFETP